MGQKAGNHVMPSPQGSNVELHWSTRITAKNMRLFSRKMGWAKISRPHVDDACITTDVNDVANPFGDCQFLF